MQYPERFSDLPEYAFPRLRALLHGTPPGGPEIAMSIGEPKHVFPEFVTDVIRTHSAGFNRYPPNEGLAELRQAIADWLAGRYDVSIDPEARILPLNGTREGLFNAALALSPEVKNGQQPAILLPNPFYQCYAAAALAAGAEPVYVNATSETGFLPDFASVAPAVLNRTTLVYMCSPSNPQGAVADAAYWQSLLDLAEAHDFIVLADECYSEIYRTAPPAGALRANANPERVVAFHSLSKRSNLPGLRSGFAVAGPQATRRMTQLRSYAGAPLPLPLQHAAAACWQDEAHVVENRAAYARKFDIADRILGNCPGYTSPEAGFFLWIKVDDGERTALEIWKKAGVKVLPGAYLSRDLSDGRKNPGREYIRAALVAPEDQIDRGLTAIRDCLS
ncbi:aminotransferase class I/II-fold pyridoxal phosphate-dependent enzyme [Halovulum sp. GXIMD14793]